MKITRSKLTTTIVSALIISGCGGNSDSPAAPNTPNLTGTLIDSPVSGVSYSTQTLANKITNAEGQFEYKTGETITFRIGDIVLGSNEAKSTITPLDLLNTNDVNDDSVVNMIRLLQTLDSDGDPSNGINITSTTRTNASGMTSINFDKTTTDFENDVMVLTQTPLVGAAAAIAHFESSLDGIGYVNDIVGAWSLDDIDSNETIAFIFTGTGTVVQVEASSVNLDCPALTCKDGIEAGSYTWDSATGDLSVSLSTDTNGNQGMSHSTNMRLIVDGDSGTLTSDDSNNTITRISGSGVPIHGGWESSVVDNKRDTTFFIFFADGKVVHVDSGEGDGYGQAGLEVASYEWDSLTGALTISSMSVDTNGEWGFSDSTNINFIVSGDKAQATSDDGGPSLDRVF